MLFPDKTVKLITALNFSKLVYSPIEENTTVAFFQLFILKLLFITQ